MTIHQWLKDYATSHQNKTNKLIHWFCVPIIFFSVYGLLSSIPSYVMASFFPETVQPWVTYGNFALIFVLIYYFRLSVPIGIGMLVFAALCVLGVYFIEQSAIQLWLASVIIFAVGWIGQFIGHAIEGEKPSFFKDLQFLLIGPAWVISFILKSLNIKY